MNNLQTSNEDKVKDLIKDAEKDQNNDNKFDNVLNKEISLQENDFKAKLEAKRKKNQLNQSDIMDKVRMNQLNNVNTLN